MDRMRRVLMIVLAVALPGAFALTPVITPAEGTYSDSVEVAIACPGADSIFYTTDRSDPTAGSTRYTAPFVLYLSSFVNATAFADGAAGEIVSVLFEIQVTDPIAVLSPNGGEVCTVGQIFPIRWTAKPGAVTSAVISVSVDAGATWLPIVDLGIPPSSPQWGDYQWQIPATLEDDHGNTVALGAKTALVKVHDYSHPGTSDVSDAVFTINASSRAQRTLTARCRTVARGGTNSFLCNGARIAQPIVAKGITCEEDRVRLRSFGRSAAGIVHVR